jgi:serine/threonine-protein kinase
VSNPIDRLTAALSDRYRLDRELGAGGMATVYLAHDLKHDRDVAIKVLHPDLGAALGGERFLSEIKTTARLQHPHILPLLDSGEADGLLYYVMPLVTGETLRARLVREKQLPIEDALRIAREVADALGAAHTLGIIHRDIKPENILLQGGHALVADFGIALAVQSAGGARMTQTGLSLGTPQYMSPEQAMGEKTIDARSDLYALGAVMYEMLTGEPPFTGATLQAVVAKAVSAEPERPSLIRKAVPPHVEAVVLKALEKLPADRYASAGDLTNALANTATTHLASRQRPAAHAYDSAGWRRIAMAAIGVATVAIALTVRQQLRARTVSGPSEYDVAFPDSVGMTLELHSGFTIAPAGDAVVFPVVNHGVQSLWVRSLLDGTLRHLDGTEGARQPTIANDGAQLAFLRERATARTIEVMPIGGGASTVLARIASPTTMQWLPDGRLLSIEDDGRLARWMDLGGGPSSTRPLGFCILPTLLPDPNALLCGGGGNKTAYAVDTRDPKAIHYFRTGAGDSALVFGTNFRLIDRKYLVYLSKSGDLLAASVDLAKRQVGRAVRMLTGISVREYSGAGSFAISQSGTLAYAVGANHAVGNLVRQGERALDTLAVSRDAFKVFAVSPNGRELAAVIDVIDGNELRIYDLTTGKFATIERGLWIFQPVWSPTGDRILYSAAASGFDSVDVFVRSTNTAQAPRRLFRTGGFEGYNWLPDGRVFGQQWSTGDLTTSSVAAAVHVDGTPVRIDTVARDIAFVRASPDGRWLTYSSVDLNTLWLEPLPANGKRYQIHGGSQTQDFFWLSSTELVFMAGHGVSSFDRVTINPNSVDPVTNPRRWIETPRALDTDGLSSTPTPDGRMIYLQGDIEPPVRSLRVIPNWVTRMKRMVDEANK